MFNGFKELLLKNSKSQCKLNNHDFFFFLFLIPSMTKIQRKIYEANLALKYFVMNEWIFKNDNFLSICDKIKLTDLKEFDFRDCFNHDAILYMRIAMRGVRKYLIHDNLNNDEKNRMKYKILKVIDKIFSSILYVLIYFVFKVLILDKFWQ